MTERIAVLTVAVVGILGFRAEGAAPKGKALEPSPEEAEALKSLAGVDASIVWSTSRESGLHDIFIMNADGSDARALTKSEHTDWFARFSPDGRNVIFVRSKQPWEPEMNSKLAERWDIFIVGSDGEGERKLVSDACWGTWCDGGAKVLFARGTKAYTYEVATGAEALVLDGDAALKRGAMLQQPQMSPDGNYVAITLRGSMRETGIWDIRNKTWNTVGGGCQINWFPSGDRILRMNESTGRGGTEVFAMAVKDGALVAPKAPYEELRFVDLPGSYSHEYFPVVSADGKWLVWCATARGHEHDRYDYEVFLWRIGRPAEEAVRLTFHSGNDRWPDICVPGERKADAPGAGKPAGE